MGMVDDGGLRCFSGGDVGGGGRWSLSAAAATRPCDYCKESSASVFCEAHAAFVCLSCDAVAHDGGAGPYHRRVWVCEVCERAPATVTCKADAAALCVACDRDIHSANPLARRHDRVPLSPFYDSAAEVALRSSYAASDPLPWDPAPPSKSQILIPDMKPSFSSFPDSDRFLDFDYHVSLSGTNCVGQYDAGNDSIVPVRSSKPSAPISNQFDIDFTTPSAMSSNSRSSLSHSVSSTSFDAGVVPEGSSASEISYSLGQTVAGGGDLSSSTGVQLAGKDREARVMRYREKRKSRRFEKTIRYASRKAYAEMRPRVKGRFAKKTEMEVDIEAILAADFSGDHGYGVVPSF
ncbi:hypothetical protein DM860_015992 [Cuscuta australis]|uniref:Uncharacterized protein n=1 Tax=Cuscuta australis TaxID=267555 RepID=A0A328DYP7_9ASTE|nr:hypothetical protein DM860_015992 [Cuscuta australis]